MRKGNKRILFIEKVDIFFLGYVLFKWVVESFIILNEYCFIVKYLN